MKSDLPRSALFARGACLAGILGALAACTVTTTPTPPDGFTAACEGTELLLAKGFRPATAVDFVGFRVESTFPRPAPAAKPAVPCPAPCDGTTDAGGGGADAGANVAAWSASFTNDVHGTLCAGATDKPACERKVAALRVIPDQCDGLAVVPKDVAAGAAAPRQTGSCAASYFLYTRGDEVGTVQTTAEALAFLGVIDAPQEAFFLARLNGELFSCGTPAAAYASVADGFELVAASNVRSAACTRRIVRVTKNGTVQLVRQDGC